MADEKNKAYQIGEYLLAYGPKVARAIDAVGEDNLDALIAEYDRLGGRIEKIKAEYDGTNVEVKMGSFFDFENGKKREEPKVVLIHKAKTIEVEEKEEEIKEKPAKKERSEESAIPADEPAIPADESVEKAPKAKRGRKKKNVVL